MDVFGYGLRNIDTERIRSGWRDRKRCIILSVVVVVLVIIAIAVTVAVVNAKKEAGECALHFQQISANQGL